MRFPFVIYHMQSGLFLEYEPGTQTVGAIWTPEPADALTYTDRETAQRVIQRFGWPKCQVVESLAHEDRQGEGRPIVGGVLQK